VQNGLVDRREGVAHKITEDIIEYIREIKKKDKLKSGADLSRMIKRKFHKKISIYHVQRILKEIGLNDRVGRKFGKAVKKNE